MQDKNQYEPSINKKLHIQFESQNIQEQQMQQQHPQQNKYLRNNQPNSNNNYNQNSYSQNQNHQSRNNYNPKQQNNRSNQYQNYQNKNQNQHRVEYVEKKQNQQQQRHHNFNKIEQIDIFSTSSQILEEQTNKLPIFPQKEDIVKEVENNQVIIISGDTGCGKSTQVPKYLLREYYQQSQKIRNSNEKRFRMVCTQPRRMAAMNLAKRVSEEMGTELGREVGYQIGMDKMADQHTFITYMTNGTFLQKLVHEQTFLASLTHIILDEVHERDTDSDFIMITLKLQLERHPSLKLILMSATINAFKFAAYFSREAIRDIKLRGVQYGKKMTGLPKQGGVFGWGNGFNNSQELTLQNDNDDGVPKWWNQDNQDNQNNQNNQDENKNGNAKQNNKNDTNQNCSGWGNNGNDNKSNSNNIIDEQKIQQQQNKTQFENDTPAKVIMISPKRNFNVEVLYLEDVQNSEYLSDCKPMDCDFDEIFTNRPPGMYEEVIKLLLILLDKLLKGKERTGVLIFLPGLNEIYLLKDRIFDALQYTQNKDQFELFTLHSVLSNNDNRRMFQHTHQTKLVLATNIAESSITVPDIEYVIDLCLEKQTTFNPISNMERLDLVWTSKASCDQRKGRTGRVCDGTVFRLVPALLFGKQFHDFTTPEILRSALDKIILRIKVLNAHEKDKKENETEHIFADPPLVLGKALDPPKVDNISKAIIALQDCCAVTIAKEGYMDINLTYLGLIYSELPCDIVISKLIVYGLALNILQEAITLAAILSHQKCLFRPSTRDNPRDALLFYQFLSKFNNSDYFDSDMLVMLVVYYEWEEKFAKQQQLKKADRETFRAVRSSFQERDWCDQHYCDPFVLRDILLVKDELLERLQKRGVAISNSNPTKLNKVDQLGKAEKQDYLLKLSVLLTASFLKVQFKSSVQHIHKEQNKLQWMREGKVQTERTLVVKCKGEAHHDTDTHSEQNRQHHPHIVSLTDIQKKQAFFDHFSLYGVVDEVHFQEHSAFIQFSRQSYQVAIKSLLHLQSAEAMANPKNNVLYIRDYARHVNHNNDKNNANKITPQSHRQFMERNVEHFQFLPSFRLNDCFSFTDVQVENNSLHRYCLSPYQSYVGFEYCERSNASNQFSTSQQIQVDKYIAKYVTRLPKVPLLAQLVVMMFSPQPDLKCEDNNNRISRYTKVTVNETDFNLPYFVTNETVNEVNRIRKMLRNRLSQNGFAGSLNHDIWNSICHLLLQPKVPYAETEEWQTFFYKQHNSQVIYRDSNNACKQQQYQNPNLQSNSHTKKQKQQDLDDECNNLIILQDDEKNEEEVQKMGKKSLQTYDSNIFPKIQQKVLKREVDIVSYQGKLAYLQENANYNQWKKDVINQYQTLENQTGNTTLICSRPNCHRYIQDMKNILGVIPNVGININLSMFFCMELKEIDPNDPFVQSPQFKHFQQTVSANLSLIGCQNGHAFGIHNKHFLTGNQSQQQQSQQQQNNVYIILDSSPVRFQLPTGHIENFIPSQVNLKAELEREKRMLDQLKHTNMGDRCIICEDFFSYQHSRGGNNNSQKGKWGRDRDQEPNYRKNIINHFKNKKHVLKMEEFKNSLVFEQDEADFEDLKSHLGIQI